MRKVLPDLPGLSALLGQPDRLVLRVLLVRPVLLVSPDPLALKVTKVPKV